MFLQERKLKNQLMVFASELDKKLLLIRKCHFVIILIKVGKVFQTMIIKKIIATELEKNHLEKHQ